MSVSQTNEAALEAYIERYLTGEITAAATRGVAENANQGYDGNRWRRGNPSDFNAEFALDEAMFWNFLENTQGKELEKLHYKPDWKRQVVERLHRKLKKDGILTVLKKGLDVDNAHFDLLYRLPYNTLNPEVQQKFESNIFSVTRQVHYSVADRLLSIDMVLFVNGLALATLELKNPWTGQNVNHAKKQYREDRDPNETLFQFRRCLVHSHWV
ncbi:MAG: type I restriction endonuclease [Verrucomicrobiota bacterium]